MKVFEKLKSSIKPQVEEAVEEKSSVIPQAKEAKQVLVKLSVMEYVEQVPQSSDSHDLAESHEIFTLQRYFSNDRLFDTKFFSTSVYF
jgi:hypothetical protein